MSAPPTRDTLRRMSMTAKPFEVEIPDGAIGGRYTAQEARSLGKTLIDAADLADNPERLMPSGRYELAIWAPMVPPWIGKASL